MTKVGFVLEVFRHPCYHVGYMNKVFSTKKKAAEFYNLHHYPFLRRLNDHQDWWSETDPRTNLSYFVREHTTGMELTIPPFGEMST